VINHSPKALQLSFRTVTAHKESGKAANVAAACKPGNLVSGKVLVVGKAEASVQLRDPPGVNVSLPWFHLADNLKTAKELFKKIRPGHTVDAALVLKSGNNGAVEVSVKPQLLLARERGFLPSEIDVVQEGAVLFGFVSNVSLVGVFVTFIDGLTGLVPVPNISDSFVKDPKDHFEIGQTVACLAVEVRPESKRLILSLKESAVELPAEALASLVESSFEEECLLHSRDVEVLSLIGKLCDAKVAELSAKGVELLILDSETRLSIPIEHLGSTSVDSLGSGDRCIVRIIDFEPKSGRCIGSLKKSLCKKAKKKHRAALHEAIESKKPMSAVVEHIRSDGRYACISVSGLQLVLAPLCDMHGARLQSLAPGLAQNSTCSVLVCRAVGMHLANVALGCVVGSPDRNRVRARSRSSSIGKDELHHFKTPIQVGAKLQGKVINVQGNWMNVALHNAFISTEGAPRKDRLRGQVHVSNSLDEEALRDAVVEGKSAFHAYNVGDFVQGVVTKIEPKTDAKGTQIVNVMLSLNGKGEEAEKVPVPGQRLPVFVERVAKDGLLVSISRSAYGFIYCTQVSTDVGLLDRIFNKGEHDLIKPGQVMMAKVLEVDEKTGKAILTSVL